MSNILEVKVPQLSESVSEATLLSWHKKVGDAVNEGDNLIDVETDKVVLELPAAASGVLKEIIKNAQDTVTSGEVIAYIDTEAVATASTTSTTEAPTTAEPAPANNVPPMPAAAQIIADNGIAADNISGSGKGGRITKGDVMAELTKPSPQSTQNAAPERDMRLNEERFEERVPMSRLRARVAERLLQSQSSNAILTTFNEVNMQPIIDLRKRYKDVFEKEHGVKLGFMSFFVKAAIAALKRYPIVNASVDGNDIIYHGYFDIGIAVGSPRGLVVPILRNAENMSLADIEKNIAEFGSKAQNGKLGIDDLTGGTFSISNGGVFGSMLSTPIINPPQSAILGIHATKERPVVENGQVVVRPMNYLALSYDHRIIDGREAVLTLVAIKEALEEPARMILEI